MKRFLTTSLLLVQILCALNVLAFEHPKIDPIKFSISTNATHIVPNEEFEIKVTASYSSLYPNLVYVFQGANFFKLKIVFPDGFKQTGGSYHEYVGTELSTSKPTASYTLKGKFKEGSGDGSFLLLRGSKAANSDSDFLLAGEIKFSAFSPSSPTSDLQTARLSIVTQAYIPYMTITRFRAGDADTSRVIYISEGKKSGIFIRNDSAPIGDNTGALTLVRGAMRYQRKHDNIFQPEWWGVVGDGITDDADSLQKAANAAELPGAELKLSGKYLITKPVLLKSNAGGSGIFFTQNDAHVEAAVNDITIKDIKIDGSPKSSSRGRGLYVNTNSGIVFENITVKNVTSQGFWCERANYIKIIGCTTDNTIGRFGDGIYVGKSLMPQVVNNHCSNFQRIGITLEGDPAVPTKDAIVIGNNCHDAIESDSAKTFPNGGIWAENIEGIVIQGNIINNVYARGIVLTPATLNSVQFQCLIDGNKISNVLPHEGEHRGVGIGLSSGFNQVVTISDNILTDCQEGMVIGWAKSVNITGNTFNSKIQDPSWFLANIQLVPSINSWTSEYVISNCINNINYPTRMPITFSAQDNMKANITISNCIGNFAFVHTSKEVAGNITVLNTLMDWSSITGTSFYMANISGKSKYDNCQLIFPVGGMLFSEGEELEITNSIVTSSAPTRIGLFSFGSRIIKVSNSSFRNVRFFDIRRAQHEIYLSNSNFDGYHTSQGLFENTVVNVANLEVLGCTFSKTNTVIPVQFANGVANASIGHNTYYSNTLTAGTFTSVRQSLTLSVGPTSSRPTVTQIGYKYFDSTLGKEIYWSGAEWIVLSTPPSFISNSSPTAPSTSSALNALYSNLKAGSVVVYQNISTGAAEYQKLTDSATSAWLRTIWSSGIKNAFP